MDTHEINQKLQWLEEQRNQDRQTIVRLNEQVKTLTQQMESTQLAKRLEWLESERRQDKKTIAALQERLGFAEEGNEKLVKRLGESELTLTRISSQLAKFSDLDTLFNNLRIEFNRNIEAVEHRRIEAEREYERVRQVERDNLNRALNEAKRASEPMARLDQEMTARREEERRLARMIGQVQADIENVGAQIEEVPAAVTRLEEAVRQETRRNANTATEASEVRRRMEEYISKLEVLEDLARRNDTKVQEMLALETDRRVSQQSWMEQQAIQSAERDRLWRSLEERAELMSTLPDEIARRMEQYAELHRATEKTVESFQGTLDRIERRLSEAAEIQRLQEEQFRQEWTSFLADDQKKWTTHMLLRDEQWREHDRDYQKTRDALATIDDELKDLNAAFTRFQQIDQVRLQNLFNLMREMLSDYDTTLQKVR